MDNQYSYNTDVTGGIGIDGKDTTGRRSKAKNRGLEGLRGIAMILTLVALLIPTVFKAGDIALQMIYVVVGYITAVTSFSALKKGQFKVSEFYIKRFKNYCPEILIVFFLYCGLAVILVHSATRAVGKAVIESVLGLVLFFIVFPALFIIWNKIAVKKGQQYSYIFLVVTALVIAIANAIAGEQAVNVYPFIVGMIAALVTKKKLKYESLPKDYKRNRLLMFLGAAVLVIIGMLFFTGENVFLRLAAVVVVAAMGLMVWLATASYLKIGGVVDIPVFKMIGKMWLEFITSFAGLTALFAAKEWTGIGARLILAVLIAGFTYLLNKIIHFIGPDSIKEKLKAAGNYSDTKGKMIKMIPLFIVTVFMLLGLFGLFVFGSTKDDAEDSTANATTELTTLPVTEKITTEATTETTTEAPKPADSKKVTIVGDFMLQGIEYTLVEYMPDVYIDASQNRQVAYSDDVVKDLKDNGNLRDIVVIILGTNGDFEEETGQLLIDAIGKEKKIYWVNTYGTSLPQINDVNKRIEKLAGKNANLNVIDWYSLAAAHPEYVSDGGPFLTSDGVDALSKLIYDNVH